MKDKSLLLTVLATLVAITIVGCTSPKESSSPKGEYLIAHEGVSLDQDQLNQLASEFRIGNFKHLDQVQETDDPPGFDDAYVTLTPGESNYWVQQAALKEGLRALVIYRSGYMSHVGITVGHIEKKAAEANSDFGMSEVDWFQMKADDLKRARDWARHGNAYQFEQVVKAVSSGAYRLYQLGLSQEEWQKLNYQHR